MTSRLRFVLALALGAGMLVANPLRAELPPLVKREIFFGNPVKAQAILSPDGTRIAYLAPDAKDVLNCWVRTLGTNDDRMVTQDEKRGIRYHVWAEDGKHLLYTQDVDGNENFHVYSVDLADGSVRDLTPHEGVRATNILLDEKHPNEMLVSLNLRDKKVFDVYRVDLASGDAKLDTENPGDVDSWTAGPDFQVRGAWAANADGSHTLRAREAPGKPWRAVATWSFTDNGALIDLAPDGKTAYVESSLGSDVTRLVRLDLATGKELQTLAVDPRSDVAGYFYDDRKHRVDAVAFNYLRKEWKLLNPTFAADFAALGKVRDGDFTIQSRDRADRKWIVSYTADDGPVATYLYDRDAKKADLLFVNQPELAKVTLAKMQGVVIESRDGLKLPSYLTLPVGVPGTQLPLILLVHGGPWARDAWGYNATTQWLANRGYAVLSVNFRASRGFGKQFLNAGNVQWGRTMQNDLTDAVQWAIQKGIADPKRVAIVGGSYGGYATLAGLAFTPDLYACGVDVVGPSNLKTLLAAIPPYWSTLKREFDLRMGDVARDSALNVEISPLFHVDRIKRPLLIGQGQKDPRVNVRESDQMVAALRAKGLPVEYVVYPDEGHGFVRPPNRIDWTAREEVFLAKYLGGRAEPFRVVAGATAEDRTATAEAATK